MNMIDSSYYLIVFFLLSDCLRYQNMNGTILSQIVWVMFLPHHCLPKVAKNCQKKAKVKDWQLVIFEIDCKVSYFLCKLL